MIVDDYAACTTIVNGGRSGIQKDEGAPSVCCALRKRPNTARAVGTLAPVPSWPRVCPTYEAIRREAEALIVLDPAFPADRFGP
jgi:hypothetical protein